MVRKVDDPHFGSVLQAGIVPHIAETPGEVRWPGPDIGQHNHEILRDLLGLQPDEIAGFAKEGILCTLPGKLLRSSRSGRVTASSRSPRRFRPKPRLRSSTACMAPV